MLAAKLILLLSAVVFTPVTSAQGPAHFSLGDTRERVRQVQGTPDVIERLTSLGVEHWSFGSATVTFDARDGRVAEWSDPRRVLRLALDGAAQGMTSQRQEARDEIRLGDTRHDVVRRLGVPWGYTRTRGGAHAILAYGGSLIRVRADDLRVDGWIARDGALPVSDEDTPAASAAMGAAAAPRRTAGERVAPAVLRGEVRWRDADGDGIVAAGEEVRLTLTVRNEGTGRAVAVRPFVVVESPSRGALVGSIPPPADVAAGGRRDFTLSLVAATPLEGTELVVVTGAREGSGFDLSPSLRLRLPARPSGAPRLVVREVRTDDATRDGRIAPREVADVTVRVANEGGAATPSLRGRIVRGEDLFVAAGAPDSFSLGPIAAGGSANVSLALYTNARAASVGAILELTDHRGVLLARLPITLPFTPGGAALVVDVPAGETGATGKRRRAPLVHEVERDLPRPHALRPDAIAVIIGVEQYRALPAARYAARDAALIRRYATQVLGVPDDDAHVVVRTDAEATGTELRRLLGEDGWLARRVTENTELFFFFAGHGAADATGRVPYLLPFDADGAFVGETGFALGTLYDRLARLPARSITVALDACFSGQTRDRRALVPGTRPGVLSIEHPALLRRNMAVLAAARGTQAAGDLPDARHGTFTWYLARGLRGEADADDDGDITVAELGRFVERGVSRAAVLANREQRPVAIARDSMRVLTTFPGR